MALRRLSNRFDCDEFPEVMNALVYALHDCDASVRRTAADEIGDQLRSNPCCCNGGVANALSVAANDCDWRTSREAAQGLRLCGCTTFERPCSEPYCCDSCCDVFCDSGCNDWVPQSSLEDFSDDDFEEEAMDSADPQREYNPAPIEERPFVPPSPVAPVQPSTNEPAAIPAAPAVFFPPTASTTNPVGGIHSSVQTTSWVR